MVLSNYSGRVSSPETATTVEPVDRDAVDAMIPVSENENGSTGVVGNGMPLDALDEISLDPPKKPEEKTLDKKE